MISSQEVRNKINEKRIGHSKYEKICNHVFVHGTNNHKECRDRHILLPSDVSTVGEVYMNTEIRFSLQEIISPTEYVVRPLKIRTKDGFKDVNDSNRFFNFDLEFRMHYMKKDNLKNFESIELGQLCVIADDESAHHRGEIIEEDMDQ